MWSNAWSAEKFESLSGSRLTGSISAAAFKIPPGFGWPTAGPVVAAAAVVGADAAATVGFAPATVVATWAGAVAGARAAVAAPAGAVVGAAAGAVVAPAAADAEVGAAAGAAGAADWQAANSEAPAVPASPSSTRERNSRRFSV